MRNLLALALILSASLGVAQTGLPLFGSFEQGPFDTVNRQNLNVNFAIPIVSAPARAGAFSYSLIYDSLIWTKSGNNWVPVGDANGVPTWGWKDSQPLSSAIHYTHFNEVCDAPPFQSSQHYLGYSYTDSKGTVHIFTLNFYQTATACQFNTQPRTGYATDGSGYYLDATGPTAPIVYSPNGDKTVGSRTDANGNSVSAALVGSETDFTDTTGRVTLKIVPIGSTSKEYRILDQTGAYTNSKATATYGSFNIKTNFACSGVTEYTANAVYLITQLLMPNGQSYSFTYEANPQNSSYKTGRIKTVTLPTGGSYEYDYPTGGNNGIYCTDGSVTSLTRIITDDSAHTWQFTRSGTGNSTTTVTAPALPYDNNVSNTMVFTFSGTSVTSQKIYQGPATGNPLRTINTTYTGSKPSVTTTILEDGQKQTKVETDYDSYANLLEKREYAWGTGSPGGLVRRTTMTYLTGAGYTTANIWNRVTRVTVKDGGATAISRTDIAYDAYGSGNSNMTNVTGALQHNDASYGQSFTYRGNPTSVTTYTNAAVPSGGITTNVFYDTLGNVRKTDVGGTVQMQMALTSTTQYSFPDSVTRGPSSPQLTTSATYDPKTGLVKTSTDENTQVTQYTYDNLRRLTDIQRPDNAHITYVYDDPNKKVTVTSPVQNTDVVKQISYLDSLGRVYRTTIADSGNTAYSNTDTQFDSLGRAYKISNPYTGSASYWTETDTDALGRVTKKTLPDSNQTTYSYVLSTVTITDPAGHQMKRDVDAQGRLVTAYEPDVTQGNTLTIQTLYTYTVLDRIYTVTQGTLGRTYLYDGLGRLTNATDPETGVMQYSYNSFNQMATRTDALGVITTYYYDTLNRPYQIIYNIGTSGVPATPTVTYTYGTTSAQYNNGRLITLDTAGIETDSFTYDQMGTVHSVSKNITGAKTYPITYGYNLAGEISSITYPSGRVATQGLDTIGRLSSISDGTRTYANAFTFNPAGQLTGYTAGNTVQATFGYSGSRLQIGTVTYAKGANTLFSLSYGYAQPNGGNNGQITAITDGITAAYSLTFTYDALGRLTRGTTANTTSPNTWDVSWIYDRYGNRTNQTENAGTLLVTNENVTFDAHNCITGGFACGASGNMSNDGINNNYVYDAENRYVKLGLTLVNTYDANSLRIEKVTGSSTVVYVYSGSQVIAEYDPAALVTAPTKEYIYLGSQILATLDASQNPIYRHPDHLSVRMYSDNSGTVTGTQGHLPFGEAWYSTGTVDKWKFTTYERDTDTNLDYAINRFDSARLARFMTPDPYTGSIDVGNPQSWNRYPYVGNDPVDLIDPLGLADCKYSRNCIIHGGGGGGGDQWIMVDGVPTLAEFVNSNPYAFMNCPQCGQSIGKYTLIPGANGPTWVNRSNGEELSPSSVAELGLPEPGTFLLPAANNSTNCQAPFLCNTGGNRNLPVVQKPPPPKPLPHVNIGACMTASLIGRTLTNSEVTLGVGAVNVAALVQFTGPRAVAAALPGPGWVYVGTAILVDALYTGAAYLECKE